MKIIGENNSLYSEFHILKDLNPNFSNEKFKKEKLFMLNEVDMFFSILNFNLTC